MTRAPRGLAALAPRSGSEGLFFVAMRSRCAVECREPQSIQFGAAAAVGELGELESVDGIRGVVCDLGDPVFPDQGGRRRSPTAPRRLVPPALATGSCCRLRGSGARSDPCAGIRRLSAHSPLPICDSLRRHSCGEQWISSSVTGILIATVPLWVVLLARSFGVHEPLGAAALGWARAGLHRRRHASRFRHDLGAVGLGRRACMLHRGVRLCRGPFDHSTSLARARAVGPLASSLAIALLLLTLPAMRVLPAHWPSAAALGSLVMLGILCTAIAMLLMFYLVNHAGASGESDYLHQSRGCPLLGIGLLHERLGAGGLAAFGMILAGSWLASRGAAQRLEPLLERPAA